MRRRTGIRGRLAWVFSGFMLLVVISVTLTYWGLNTTRQDARVINLAGRQRMLVQQMARLSLELEQEGDASYRSELADTANSFDQTLRALRNGGTLTDYTGETVVLARSTDPAVVAALDALAAGWQTFRPQVEQVTAAGTGGREVQAASPDVMARADAAVRALEAAAQGRLTRLHWFQLGFLVSALLLVASAWWILQVSIVLPVKRLEQAARRMSAGDLESPVSSSGPVEVLALAGEMESGRRQLRTWREERQAWVDQLEQRVRQRTAAVEALAKVGRDITSHLDLATVLKSVTGMAQNLLGGQVAELCLLDPDGRTLRLHATAGPEAALRQGTSALSPDAAGRVLDGKTAWACPAGSCPGFCDILDPSYRASHLAAPVRLGDHVIGALCVGSAHAGTFGPDALVLLTQLAEAAAVALENARLYEQAGQSATLLERQRIASEMHDGLLQTLSVLRWTTRLAGEQLAQGQVERAQEMLQRIERANAQAEREIRRAITSFHEDFPVQVTLQEQLAAVIAETASGAPAAQFDNHVSAPIVLMRSDGEQVLRVAREALLNALRYSQAQQISLRLEREGRQFMLAVQDDGLGFDPDCLPDDDRPHFGIKVMQARAARLGGKLTIDSAPRQGTRVTLRWSPEE